MVSFQCEQFKVLAADSDHNVVGGSYACGVHCRRVERCCSERRIAMISMSREIMRAQVLPRGPGLSAEHQVRSTSTASI